MNFKVEYDEMGGYDCLSPAFIIRDRHDTVAELDLRHYGYRDEGLGEGVQAHQEKGRLAAQRNAYLFAAAPEMLEALRLARRLHDEALPKFGWGKSALDANAIWLLNEFGLLIPRVLAKVDGK